MKKFLLSLAALAMCISINAETRIYPTYGDATSTLSYELGTTTVKSVEYKTVTFSLANNDAATAFEIYFKGDNMDKVASVVREAALKVQDEEEEPNYLYTLTLYSSSKSQFGLPFVLAKWNDAVTSVDITPIGNGKCCTIRIAKDATGTLDVDGAVFNAEGKGYNLKYLSIDLGASAINEVQAAGSANAAAKAYNLAGQRVNDSAKGLIIKGGKKILK